LVCIDGTSTFEKAKTLSYIDWEHNGIALLLSATNDVASRLKRRELAAVHQVQDFSFEELRAFLSVHGKQHLSIATDVERLIRRPILASVYIRANPSPEWVPASEYALLDAYWRSVDDPAVKSTLHRLADTLLGGQTSYPWRIANILQSGLSKDDIRLLTNDGILRDSEDSCVEFWH
jgi:hypothetical protein